MSNIYKKTDLFVIVTDWFDNPFEDLVYTDLEEAKRLSDEHNVKTNGFHIETDNRISRSAGGARVMNLDDYVCHERDRSTESAGYDYRG